MCVCSPEAETGEAEGIQSPGPEGSPLSCTFSAAAWRQSYSHQGQPVTRGFSPQGSGLRKFFTPQLAQPCKRSPDLWPKLCSQPLQENSQPSSSHCSPQYIKARGSDCGVAADRNSCWWKSNLVLRYSLFLPSTPLSPFLKEDESPTPRARGLQQLPWKDHPSPHHWHGHHVTHLDQWHMREGDQCHVQADALGVKDG